MIFSFFKKSNIAFTTLFLAVPMLGYSQAVSQNYTVISTAVPFLTISPDSKAASMGDAGVASNSDANSIFWNTSKLAFAEDKSGISISYAPWLKDIVSDMSLLTLNGYRKINDNQALTAGFTYFDQGSIQFTDASGNNLDLYHSREWVATAGIAQKLNSNFSLGLNWKYVNSNLVGSYGANGQAAKPGRTMAVDLGFYYNRTRPDDDPNALDIAYGLVIQNFGGKVNYGQGEFFIPANLKFGTKISKKSGEHNNFTLLIDFNKLLVPTPTSTTTNTTKLPSAFKSLFSSFSDAPGGMSEEMKEVMVSVGAEYSYDKLLALRGGYFYESKYKGGRQYFTSGLGFTFKDAYVLDVAYLVPVNSGNPLANSWRLSFNFLFH